MPASLEFDDRYDFWCYVDCHVDLVSPGDEFRGDFDNLDGSTALQARIATSGLDAATKHVAGVMLPAPGTDGSAIYGLMQSPGARGTRPMKCIPLPREGFGPFHEVWGHVSKAKAE